VCDLETSRMGASYIYIYIYIYVYIYDISRLRVNIVEEIENKNTINGCQTFGSVQAKQFTFINNSVRSLDKLA